MLKEMPIVQLSPEREEQFKEAETKLHFLPEVYHLGERFEGLPSQLANLTLLDVTKIPGCHYGARNVFVPIIHHLEEYGVFVSKKERAIVSPQTAILVEPSTGNGWVAFSEAAESLGYEHLVIMPDGLPEARYCHPAGRSVQITRTLAQDYALGMPKALLSLVMQNRCRLKQGEKIYVSPNHAVSAADITVNAMSELGEHLLTSLKEESENLRIVVSMGNGSSLCALGEYVKDHKKNAKVVATESFHYGGGYDHFAKEKGLRSYIELFDINPGHPDLMAKFSAFGTNAPIGIELPLQARAIKSELIDDYVLFTDNEVLNAYLALQPKKESLRNALDLPNYRWLPRELFETYGNSTLANIAVAVRFASRGERVVAMAYDGRQNY